jgi:hypothetical protein
MIAAQRSHAGYYPNFIGEVKNEASPVVLTWEDVKPKKGG